MKSFTPMKIGRIGLALAALLSVATVAGPAAADWHHRHDNGAYFSCGIGTPGYYYNPPSYYYGPPSYYAHPSYYEPAPPAYYYPPPSYYEPGPSFNFSIGNHQ